MKLETLRTLWQAKNPTGNVWSVDSAGHLSETTIKGSKKFAVIYSDGGKIYTYTASSVYKLAERFNLIPESNLNYWTEAEACIKSIKAGGEYITLCALQDTVSDILSKETGLIIVLDGDECGLDEFDRRLFKFTGFSEYNPQTWKTTPYKF